MPSPLVQDQLETDTAARLRAASGKLARRLRNTEAGAAAGLTPTRISVLLTIARRGPIGLSELAEDEGLNPTMLSRVVADFAAAGLVQRVSDPGDARAALVSATASGRRLRDRMLRERTDALNLALSGLSRSERHSLEQALPVLEKVVEQLKRRRP